MLSSMPRASAAAARSRPALPIAAARPGGLAVTASVGGTSAAGVGVDEAEMYRIADAALYRAKRAGRDRVVVDPLPAADLRITAA